MSVLPSDLSGWSYGAMGAMVLVGACLQGIGGVGFAMFSAPIAALFFPALLPGPLLVLGGAVSLLSVARERHAVDWPAAAIALVGRAVGTLIAIVCLVRMPAAALAVLFAAMILAGVVASVGGWDFRATRTTIGFAGVGSGLMGTITSAGAPPFALVMQHVPPATIRATLGVVFGVGSAFSLLMLASIGRFTRHHLELAAWLLPLMLVGFLSSGPLNRRISRRAVRRVLLALSTAGAVGIIAKVVLG